MIPSILKDKNISIDLKKIAEKVYSGKRINTEEALTLFEKGELGFLGVLANHLREAKHGKNTYYIKNFHIEPSNICAYNCKFCSFSDKHADFTWNYSIDEIADIVKQYKNESIAEIHITGAANPDKDLSYYTAILKAVKRIKPGVHLKAYSAVEIYYIAKKSQLSYQEVLLKLKEAGLDSIPGGGAEIFDEDIRKQICPEKVSSSEWLKIHETAHLSGLSSNATMLYGHIENYSHRIDHLNRLRELQDKTKGFLVFVPLKFKNKNNKMNDIKETLVIDDLKNYAISRIFLDNFPHIKAYWPMLGKSLAQVSLSFGVDDIDGTIDDTTKIYTLAGADNKSQSMTTNEMINLIKAANRIPIEKVY